MPVLPRRAAVLLVAVTVLATAGPARAQEDRPAPTGVVDTPGTDAAISAALDGIRVDGDEYRLVAADYELVKAARIRARSEKLTTPSPSRSASGSRPKKTRRRIARSAKFTMPSPFRSASQRLP